jgi:nucleotide-binding universal stress UspA family protein
MTTTKGELHVPNHVSGPIVVGVDGSVGSRAAVDLAAREANRRRLPLRLVHVVQSPPIWFDHPAPAVDFEEPLSQARAMLAETAQGIAGHHPELAVSNHLTAGNAAAVLVEESQRSSLVVVGTRGHGGFTGQLIGSVSSQVVSHAHCPVIVARPRGDEADAGTSAPVVVGVDGSAESTAALGFAFEAASGRGVPLVAVYVWQALPTGNLGPVDWRHYDPVEAETEAGRLLAEQMAGWQEQYPEVVVDRQAVYGFNPAETLVEASKEAQLVVVGSRGRGGFARPLLGSVSQALIHHAHCSVAVVHAHTVQNGQS